MWGYQCVDRLRKKIADWIENHQDHALFPGHSLREVALSGKKFRKEDEENVWLSYLRGVRSARYKQWGDEITLLAASGVVRRQIITLSGERGKDPFVVEYSPPASWGSKKKEGAPLLFLLEKGFHFTPVKVKEGGDWSWTVPWNNVPDPRLVVKK